MYLQGRTTPPLPHLVPAMDENLALVVQSLQHIFPPPIIQNVPKMRRETSDG